MEKHQAPKDPTPPPRPRWVKVSAIIVGIAFAALLILALTGNHGPGRHAPEGSRGEGHRPAVEHAP